MTQDELISAVGRLRRRLRGHAHLFEDPSSYVDGVEDALDWCERLLTVEDGEPDPLVVLEEHLERTAS